MNTGYNIQIPLLLAVLTGLLIIYINPNIAPFVYGSLLAYFLKSQHQNKEDKK